MNQSRTCIVTGANGVFGRFMCRMLAKDHGYSVIAVVRSEMKGEEVVKFVGGENVTYEICDLTTSENIRQLVNRFGVNRPLQCLVNNAAITPKRRQESELKEELQWSVNVLAYHRMTRAFLPNLKLAAEQNEHVKPRVVFVASFYAGGLDLSDPEFKQRRYNADSAYRASKQADRMLAKAWSLQESTNGIACVSCHPGVATSAVSMGLGMDLDRSENAQRSGAKTPVYLATTKDNLSDGGYYQGNVTRCEFCVDTNACTKLFQICEGYR